MSCLRSARQHFDWISRDWSILGQVGDGHQVFSVPDPSLDLEGRRLVDPPRPSPNRRTKIGLRDRLETPRVWD